MRRPVREQAEEIAQVRPRFDLAELGAREERGEGRVYGSAIVAADEELRLRLQRGCGVRGWGRDGLGAKARRALMLASLPS